MANQGEIIIDENTCSGCGYCELFCPRGCIEVSKKKINQLGYPLAVFTNPNDCNACGICGTMCPQFSIEVYKIAS